MLLSDEARAPRRAQGGPTRNRAALRQAQGSCSATGPRRAHSQSCCRCELVHIVYAVRTSTYPA
eukprot:4582877-Prymnesium_polylepis.2